MFGLNFHIFDYVTFIASMTVTLYVIIAKNPFEKGTNEYTSLRLCRIGLALLFWPLSTVFWSLLILSVFNVALYIALAFALLAFIFGIIGIVRGRTLYGIIVIIGSVVSPAIGFFSFVKFMVGKPV